MLGQTRSPHEHKFPTALWTTRRGLTSYSRQAPPAQSWLLLYFRDHLRVRRIAIHIDYSRTQMTRVLSDILHHDTESALRFRAATSQDTACSRAGYRVEGDSARPSPIVLPIMLKQEPQHNPVI